LFGVVVLTLVVELLTLVVELPVTGACNIYNKRHERRGTTRPGLASRSRDNEEATKRSEGHCNNLFPEQ